MEKKEIKISYFKKDGRLPEGVYMFKKPNIWYPVVYFRKPKGATKKEFETVKDYLINQ